MAKILIVERIIFYLALLFLPTQLGRHFWPAFSSVLGVRVDYLSPTLYFTDVLVLILLGLVLLRLVRTAGFKYQVANSGNYWKFIAVVLFLVFGILQAKNPFAGWYGLLKFLEFFFFGLYVSWQKIKFSKIAFVFSLTIIFESFLAISQYFVQGSLGGLFYYFGERTFNSQTPGIANASLNGELILRPYGTLPHPNVLGGYLTIALAMVISNFQFPSPKGQALLISNFKKMIYGGTLVVGTVALVLTMSRIAILLWLVILGFSLLKRKGFTFLFLLPILIIFAVSFFFPLATRLFNANIADESVVERVELAKSSLLMIKDSPIIGVGINNFLVSLPSYQEKPDDIFALQPVHNIYLLIAAETGIVGLVFFLWFLEKTFQEIRKKKPMIRNPALPAGRSLFIILSAILILGFFDHYFLTLQQGRMLFAFVLSLCWSKKLMS